MKKIHLGTIALLVIAFLFFGFIHQGVNAQNLPGANSSRSATDPIRSLTDTIIKTVGDSKTGKSSLKGDALVSVLGPTIEQRKLLLTELIKKNPAVFLRSVVPTATRNALPSSLQSDVEVETTATSYLKVVQVDDFAHPENSHLRYFIDVQPKKNLSLLGLFGLGGSNQASEEVEIFPTKPINMRSGAQVKVHGYKLMGLMALDNNDSTGSGLDVLSDAPAPDAVGNQRTLIILLKEKDSDPEPFTPSYIHDYIFKGQFQKFMEEQSYGKVSFSGDVYGWYTLGHTADCYGEGSAGLTNEELGSIIIKYGIDLQNYDRVVYMTGPKYGGCSGIGKSPLVLNGKTYQVSTALVEGVNNYDQPDLYGPQTFQWTNIDAVLSHEMGHGLGLSHANGLDCHGQVSGGDCEHIEYGNPFDIMGQYPGSVSLQYQGLYKDILGWIGNDQRLLISKSGNYTLSSLESDTGYNYAKIVMSGSNRTVYTVENRRGLGFDSTLNREDLEWKNDGLLITKVVSGSPQTTHLLNMSASTKQEWRDSIYKGNLNGNSIFKDPSSGITIGPITKVDGSSIGFNVDVDPVSCVHVEPQISSVSLINQNIINFAITNNDYLSCGKSTFQTDLILPADWISQPSNMYENIIEPGNKAYKFLNFMPNNAAIGSYNIVLKVTNTQSGQASTYSIKRDIISDFKITSIEPSQGSIDTRVVIHGAGFGPYTSGCIVDKNGNQSCSQNIYPGGDPNTLIYTIPSTLLTCDTNGCKFLPITSGKYKIVISNSIVSASADFTLRVIAPFSVSVVDDKMPPSLKITYDSNGKEAELIGEFYVNIDAGNNDQSIGVSDAFRIFASDLYLSFYPTIAYDKPDN
ncbi:MAG: hypothetical protein WCT02_03055, partial [Candidatus Paceibacterota bacterium]